MAKIVIKNESDGSFCFYVKARNGQINLASIRFGSRDRLNSGLTALRDRINENSAIEYRRTFENEPYFVVLDNDRTVLAESRCYSNMNYLKDGLINLRRNIERAEIEDAGGGGRMPVKIGYGHRADMR